MLKGNSAITRLPVVLISQGAGCLPIPARTSMTAPVVAANAMSQSLVKELLRTLFAAVVAWVNCRGGLLQPRIFLCLFPEAVKVCALFYPSPLGSILTAMRT